MSLEVIKEELGNAYDFFIIPTSALDIPIEMDKMLKEDGTFYSINELSSLLGDFFTPTPIIDERFSKFRWAVPANGEDSLIIGYLKSKGLVDMRDNGIDDALNSRVDEIDFTALNGNEFGYFRRFELQKVPKAVSEAL